MSLFLLLLSLRLLFLYYNNSNYYDYDYYDFVVVIDNTLWTTCCATFSSSKTVRFELFIEQQRSVHFRPKDSKCEAVEGNKLHVIIYLVHALVFPISLTGHHVNNLFHVKSITFRSF